MKHGDMEVVGATFMAPVVAMVNSTETHNPNDGRHECGPYDFHGPLPVLFNIITERP